MSTAAAKTHMHGLEQGELESAVVQCLLSRWYEGLAWRPSLYMVVVPAAGTALGKALPTTLQHQGYSTRAADSPIGEMHAKCKNESQSDRVREHALEYQSTHRVSRHSTDHQVISSRRQTPPPVAFPCHSRWPHTPPAPRKWPMRPPKTPEIHASSPVDATQLGTRGL